MAILQGTVAPEMQGRVFTIMGSLLLITSPIGLAIAGPVSDLLGLNVWLLTAGVLCSLAGLAGFFVPAMTNIEQNHSRPMAAVPEVATAGD
jgi:DHA3 family macrolide efflux protein-like MFS transporter